MVLWVTLALMTIAALAFVVAPLFSGGDHVAEASEAAVYKDQLAEIDRDLEAGLIEATEAGAARTEVSRRLLRAVEASEAAPDSSLPRKQTEKRRLATLGLALLLLPVVAGGLYLQLGSPFATPPAVTADRTPAESDDAEVRAMIDQVEEYLKDVPGDGRGWEALAPIYMRMGRYDEAIRAWRNTIANLGDSAEREENLGESLVEASNGVVSAEARKAFEQALAIDPGNIAARFYGGLAAKQDGRREEAARIWSNLIASATPDAEWVDTVREALLHLDDNPEMAAGEASSSPEQQTAMIRTMVAGLAERLKVDGLDPDGWLRLVRSYNVLRDPAKADDAIRDARKALAQDTGKLAQFDEGLAAANQSASNASPREPEAQDIAAATPPEHQNASVRAMVDKLARRLDSEGGDIESWYMLVRSYETLAEHAKMLATIARARMALAPDREALARFDGLLRAQGISVADDAPRGETSSLPEPDQAQQETAMIKGMVDRLADRLRQDGHDVEGWMRLMRSYIVLGQRDQAIAAGRNAHAALGNDVAATDRVDATAKELGINLF